MLARASIARALDRPRPRTTHTRPSCSKQMTYGGQRRPVRVQHVSARDKPLAAYSTAGAAIGVGVRALRLHRLGVPHRAECSSVHPHIQSDIRGPCVCVWRARAPCQLQFAHICGGWLAFLGFLPWAVLARPIGGRRAEQSAPLRVCTPHALSCCRRDVPPRVALCHQRETSPARLTCLSASIEIIIGVARSHNQTDLTNDSSPTSTSPSYQS